MGKVIDATNRFKSKEIIYETDDDIFIDFGTLEWNSLIIPDKNDEKIVDIFTTICYSESERNGGLP